MKRRPCGIKVPQIVKNVFAQDQLHVEASFSLAERQSETNWFFYWLFHRILKFYAW